MTTTLVALGWKPTDDDGYFARRRAVTDATVRKLATRLRGALEQFGPTLWLITVGNVQLTVSAYVCAIASTREIVRRDAAEDDEDEGE